MNFFYQSSRFSLSESPFCSFFRVPLSFLSRPFCLLLSKFIHSLVFYFTVYNLDIVTPRARTRQIKASKIVFSLTELSRNQKKSSELFFVKAVLRRNEGVKKHAELWLKSISGLFFEVVSPKLITVVLLRLLMKFYMHTNQSKLAYKMFIAMSE